MKRVLFVVFAFLCAALGLAPTLTPISAQSTQSSGTTPTSAPFPVSVSNTTYPGAATEAALIADFQAASTATTSCWPMDEGVGVTGTAFLNQCLSGGDPITFYDSSGTANDGGFTAGVASPAIISANDEVSVEFSSQNNPMPTGTLLSSTAKWTVGFAFNAGSTGSNMDLVNTGAAAAGTGMEVYLDASGHVRFDLGNGSGGNSQLESAASDSSGANSHAVFVSWTPGSPGTATLTYDNVSTSLSVANFSAGSKPLEIIKPVSGSGTSAFIGNFGWLSYFADALSSATESNLYLDMTGAVAPVATVTPNPNAPITHSASQFANNVGLDTEFNYSSTAADVYLEPQSINAFKFLGVTNLRDADNDASSGPYNQFCSQGIGYSQGFNPTDTTFTGPPGNLLKVSDVTSQWDKVKAATGCYPTFTEDANELDNYGSTSPYDAADPTFPGKNIPMWATLLVEEMHTIAAARASNSKYAGIKLFGPGLANADYNDLSLAQENYYPGQLFPVDVAAQHTGQQTMYDAPENPTGGVLKSTINLIYAQTPDGFSGYASAGPNLIPHTWDEFGEGYASPYESSGNALDNPLAAHYVPRLMLTIYDKGLNYADYWDFLTDHTCAISSNASSNGCAFSQNGFLDLHGNLKPQGYAMANLNHFIGYGNVQGVLTEKNVTQLNYSVVNSSGSTPTNLAKYTFQNDDGSYWIVLNDPSEEGIHYPNGAQAGYDKYLQGSHWGAFVGFTTVSITGLPSSITHAAVYQNDEFCDATRTQVTTTWGTPLQNYPTGPDTDCYQWWPAGSLNPSVQPSYPTVSGGKIAGIKYNGMPLLIRVSGSRITLTPTMSPQPEYNYATPAGVAPIPTQAASKYFLPTPVPSFSPPSGQIPTPPA